MIAGLFIFFNNLKQAGRIKPDVTWEQFKQSQCWHNKHKLTQQQRENINKNIIQNGNTIC